METEINLSIDQLLSKLLPEGSVRTQTRKEELIYDGNLDCLGSLSIAQNKQNENNKAAKQFNILSHHVQNKHYQIDKKYIKQQLAKINENKHKPQGASQFIHKRQETKKKSNVMNNLMLKLRK